MAVSGKTKVCGLIGDPVEHTMSPAIHNAAFRELGLDYIYLPFHVKKEGLVNAITGMRALNIRGLNVTIPHKVDVLRFLELSRGCDPSNRKVAVLGAGGASRAISFILAERGAHLVILNRRLELEWAEELAGRISTTFSRETRALELNRTNLTGALEKAEILVNATSVGMSPDTNQTPVDSDLLRPDLIVSDIVYNPVKTRLLREAETAGVKTVEGLEMLVWQGALAFEKWTGQKAPIELMRKEATRMLDSQRQH